MSRIIYITFMACLSILPIVWTTEYGYNPPIGPNSWSKLDPKWKICGSGKRQSPVNIPTHSALGWPLNLEITNQDVTLRGKLENNKHAIEFSIETEESNRPMFLAKYNGHSRFRDAEYTLQQFHFHWGANDATGSENRLNSKQYSGEMHFVTKNKNFDETGPNGYLVLAVLLKVCDGSGLNAVFGEDDSILKKIASYPDEVEISLKLGDIYSCTGACTHTNKYYVFQGSFTTPPCTQAVTWWVADAQLCISEAQIKLLRSQKVSETGPVLSHNWRPVQDFNHRKLLINKN